MSQPFTPSDWWYLSGIFAGWLSLIISMGTAYVGKRSEDRVDKLISEVLSFRQRESRRVEGLIQTVKSLASKPRRRRK